MRTRIQLTAIAAVSLVAPVLSAPANVKRSLTSDVSSVRDRTFDYIVAGGGLTGLTVAGRLSEDRNISVLVIEGGQNDSDDPRVYDVRAYGQAFQTDLDYNITSTPIPWRNNETLPMVAGKTLGGSSSINGGSWTKGAKTQYDLLPSLSGDDSWGWEGLNPHMLMAECFHPPTSAQIAKGARFEPEAHGYNGSVQVSFPPGMFGNIQLPVLNASQLVWEGLRINSDAASGLVNGATMVPDMLHPDQQQNRSSSYTAYIQGAPEARSNLVVLTGHRVTRIRWRNSTEIAADGVEFQASRDGEVFRAKARREVLLAAGSMQSPQILELSGVGDPTVLERAGVPLVKALRSVGKNLQEQVKTHLTYVPKNTNFNGTGPSSAIVYPNVHQLLKNNASAVYAEVMHGLPAYAASLAAAGHVVNANATLNTLRQQVDNLFNQSAAAVEVFFTLSPNIGEVGVDIWNLIVLARGTVHVTSNSSWTHPTVEPAYFRHPLDLILQTAGTMQARDVYQTQPLSFLVTTEKSPGLSTLAENATQADWESWVRKTFTSVWHPIGTLSMMEGDMGGAVDSRLRVYGLGNVRAVDASVLPIQLSAHLSSSLYGIAEKAARTIREDWGN